MTTTLTVNPTVTIHVSKIAPRQFRAAVAFKPAPSGWLVSDICGKRPTAVKNLEAKLRLLGVTTMPEWKLNEVIIPATQPEATVAPVVEPEAHTAPAAEPDVADVAEQAIEDAKVSVAAIPDLARMAGGVVTPVSDLAKWTLAYNEAVKKFSGIDFPGENPREQIANYREAVGLVMEAAGCVAPWRRTMGGDCWIRFAGNVVDLTVRQPRHRKAHVNAQGQAVVDPRGQWDLSRKKAPRLAKTPNPVRDLGEGHSVKLGPFSAYVSNGTINASLPKAVTFDSCTLDDAKAAIARKQGRGEPATRAERKATPAEKPVSKSYVPVTEADELAYSVAYRYAVGQSKLARERGKDHVLTYKVAMCASLRSQGATPHTKFEAVVAAAGINLDAVVAKKAA